MNVYYFFSPVYLPEIKNQTGIQIDFDSENQPVKFNLSGSSADATFREYDGSLHNLFFYGSNSPAEILTELSTEFDIRFLSESDFLNYYESEGNFDEYIERKMRRYFLPG